jgi:hypothetical protein
MDDTAAIRRRLGRIGALAEAGAGRRELLREVRGLLEEGERTLWSERTEAGSDRASGVEPGASPGITSSAAGAVAEAAGLEAVTGLPAGAVPEAGEGPAAAAERAKRGGTAVS